MAAVKPEGAQLAKGDTFDLGDTYCSITLNADGPVGFTKVSESSFATHPAYGMFSLESYIGIPIYRGGTVYGTLNFSSAKARERAFKEVDIDCLKLMGSWISSELDRRYAEAGMVKANTDLMEFGHLLAHDLRGSLMTVSSFGAILDREIGGSLSQEHRRYLGGIVSAAKGMKGIVDGLSGLALLAKQKLRQEVDLSALAKEIINDLRRLEPDRSVKFEAADGLIAKGDPNHLRLLLTNLLQNAWKFTAGHDPARIYIRCRGWPPSSGPSGVSRSGQWGWLRPAAV